MPNSAPVLLVTGASRGIGAAIARLAARRGFDVAVNYLKDRKSADAVVADGFDFHLPRGYIYSAMAFAAAVEAINVVAQRRRRARRRDKS